MRTRHLIDYAQNKALDPQQSLTDNDSMLNDQVKPLLQELSQRVEEIALRPPSEPPRCGGCGSSYFVGIQRPRGFCKTCRPELYAKRP